jgi:chorismate lyase/3-hydroxybenzoate synthase
MLRHVHEIRRAQLAAVRAGSTLSSDDSAPWLIARIPKRPLSEGSVEEVFPAAGLVSRIDIDGALAAADDRSVFVALEAEAGAGIAIESLTFEVYRRLLRGVTRAGFPHLLRVWNFVPRIHDKSSGLENYMRFCKGRSDAFAAHYGVSFPDRLPAASAVGCPGDSLVVHLLASREPGDHVENPRQVSAYRYPERYGPKSPSFARGTKAPRGWDGVVFVSGTASIVGHESVFPGDPVRQVEETMRNIEAVVDAAGAEPALSVEMGRRRRARRGQLHAARDSVARDAAHQDG